MPRRVFLPNWVWYVVLVSVILEGCLTDTFWFLLSLVIMLIIQGVYVFHLVRCPTCNGRLTFHQAFIPNTTRYRFQLACGRCQVVWDTGKISDHSTL